MCAGVSVGSASSIRAMVSLTSWVARARSNGGPSTSYQSDESAGMIAEVLNALAQSPDGKAPLVEAAIKEQVKALTDRFPIYQ